MIDLMVPTFSAYIRAPRRQGLLPPASERPFTSQWTGLSLSSLSLPALVMAVLLFGHGVLRGEGIFWPSHYTVSFLRAENMSL